MYDLFEMEQPSHIVNDYVELAHLMVGSWATKVVNGAFLPLRIQKLPDVFEIMEQHFMKSPS